MKMSLIVLSLLLLSSFNIKKSNNLAETQWSFVKFISENQIIEGNIDCKTTLVFHKNGDYSGFSGWNIFNGKYSVTSKGKLTMDNPNRTKKAGDKKCKLGENLFDLYPNVATYTIKSDSLYLCTTDCNQMVFVKIK